MDSSNDLVDHLKQGVKLGRDRGELEGEWEVDMITILVCRYEIFKNKGKCKNTSFIVCFLLDAMPNTAMCTLRMYPLSKYVNG